MDLPNWGGFCVKEGGFEELDAAATEDLSRSVLDLSERFTATLIDCRRGAIPTGWTAAFLLEFFSAGMK